MTYQQWLNEYHKSRSTHERLGQAFVNDFIKHAWPELFYNNDITKCATMIENWLHEYHYYGEMPQKIVY